MLRLLVRFAILAAPLLALAPSAARAVLTDPVGDFIPSYTVGPKAPGLDVTSVDVTFDGVNFTLTGTMAGPILTNTTWLYVWGIDRGAGTARFASIGIDRVTFDSVLVLTASTSSGRFNDLLDPTQSQNLAAGSVTIAGSTITAILPNAILVPHGIINPVNYGFNLWPRSGAGGNEVISDFAPDNSVFSVPEPMSLALVAAGLTGVTAMRRRRGPIKA